MMIIGCDFHPRYQPIAMMDELAGWKLAEKRHPGGGWIPGWEFAAGNLLLVWGATKCLQSGSTAQGDTLFDLCTIFWVLAIFVAD
jgi:hypothetical protein